MSFTDHKITAFAHKIADLADQPTLPPDELKSRFDACPEELRQSLNAVCDDAARLEARVEGIVVDTFGDTIDKEMLSDELAAELDAKATQSALDSTADALDERLDAVETALPQKCEVYIGSYVGDGATTRTIELEFTPAAVLVERNDGARYNYSVTCPGGMALPGLPCGRGAQYSVEIVENGFKVRNKVGDGDATNVNNSKYMYLAFH